MRYKMLHPFYQGKVRDLIRRAEEMQKVSTADTKNQWIVEAMFLLKQLENAETEVLVGCGGGGGGKGDDKPVDITL